mmetsp:Transcript_323/g.2578  ORF Transcript_323/g.2578 Transcript_323/m.2578 type:complete len:204 (-) Transcript_323:4816-5427(-)
MRVDGHVQPPTFGSATAFGGEKGFGGFAAAAAQAARDATSFPSKSSGDAAAEEEDQAAEEGEEEECKAEFQPLVQLDEVATSTGEEDEDVFFQVCVQRKHRNRNPTGKAAIAIHAKDGADEGRWTSTQQQGEAVSIQRRGQRMEGTRRRHGQTAAAPPKQEDQDAHATRQDAQDLCQPLRCVAIAWNEPTKTGMHFVTMTDSR